MRPWIIQSGPMFIPTDARQELQSISECVGDEYVSHVWKLREAEKPQPSKSMCNWPAKFNAAPAGVIRLPVGVRG